MKTPHFRWQDNGDSALTLVISTSSSEQLSRQLWEIVHIVRERAGGEVADIVPGYNSITFVYAPFSPIRESIIAWVTSCLDDIFAQDSTLTSNRTIDIPVCYEPDYAPDLQGLSHQLGLSMEDIISLHAGTIYFVHMLGFSPGFMYLGGLHERLYCPRKPTPSLQVPAGSVAIGGAQTGVYPQTTPGGWHIIGRTPMMLFNPIRQPLTLVQPLEQVRFVRIDKGKFLQLSDGELV